MPCQRTARGLGAARGAPSYRPSVVRASTLYSSLDMPPLLDTKPTEPGRCSLHATMLSSVPAVSPMRNAPACRRELVIELWRGVARQVRVGCLQPLWRPCGALACLVRSSDRAAGGRSQMPCKHAEHKHVDARSGSGRTGLHKHNLNHLMWLRPCCA